MILSQIDIRRAVEAGEIGFSPSLEEKQWGEVSVDLRLGFQFTKLRDVGGHSSISVADGLDLIARMGLWSTKTLRERDEHGNVEQYPLPPKEFVLAMTHESIKVPKNMIALVEGRSTYARVGLSMHQNCSLDSARMGRSYCTGNHEQRSYSNSSHATDRQTVSGHVL
jgi:dCTP deaminase